MDKKIKPSIETSKLLSAEEKPQVKEFLIGKAHIEAIPAKNDYVDDKHRGTVHFNDERGNMFDKSALKMRNYSFHKVIIPDGTVVEGCNFTQAEPHTEAIQGKNLVFKQCNLKNVEIDPSWTLESCLAIHAKEREEKGEIIYEVEKDGKWVEVSREKIEEVEDVIAR